MTRRTHLPRRILRMSTADLIELSNTLDEDSAEYGAIEDELAERAMDIYDPIDYDAQDRRAADEERISNFLNER